MAGKNEYTVFDYLQWRGDLTLQQDPFNEVDNLVLCIIAYINLRKIDRLWSKNPKDAMPIGDVCARLTAADEQLGLSSLDYIPVMRAAAETDDPSLAAVIEMDSCCACWKYALETIIN